jgi:hypothetical protein
VNRFQLVSHLDASSISLFCLPAYENVYLFFFAMSSGFIYLPWNLLTSPPSYPLSAWFRIPPSHSSSSGYDDKSKKPKKMNEFLGEDVSQLSREERLDRTLKNVKVQQNYVRLVRKDAKRYR